MAKNINKNVVMHQGYASTIEQHIPLNYGDILVTISFA